MSGMGGGYSGGEPHATRGSRGAPSKRKKHTRMYIGLRKAVREKFYADIEATLKKHLDKVPKRLVRELSAYTFRKYWSGIESGVQNTLATAKSFAKIQEVIDSFKKGEHN